MSKQAIKELKGKIEAKRNRLATLFASKHPDGSLNLTAQERDEVKAINRELNEDLGPRFEQLLADDRAESDNAAALKTLNAPVAGVPIPGASGGAGHDGYVIDQFGRPVSMMGHAVKSIGEQFVEHENYKSFVKTPNLVISLPEFDVKTLFQTSAGWAPFVERRPGIVLSPQQQPRIVDLIPSMETSQSAIKWMLETTYTNNAAETAEDGNYPESVFQATEQTTPVNKFAVTLPATDEQLDDVPGARDYLNNRLTLNLRQRLDSQLWGGNGTSPNLKGMTQITGIQTQAKGADSDFDAILKAINNVQSVGFADPSAVLMHPNDWTKLRLIRSNGLYVLGYPGDAVAPRLWGLPVVTSTYVTATIAMVADFATYTELWYRKGISFDLTNSHASEFTAGVQRFRAQMRVAFVVTRPTALCEVTGLAGT
jgi:hypothetical protein